MMISALKIRWFGSVYRAGVRLVALSVFLGSIAACSHAPAERSYAGDRNGTSKGSTNRGSVHFSIFAPDAEGVRLILLKSQFLTPVTYEVQARKAPNGTWSAYLDLIPGEYRYFFIVDGSVTVIGGADRVEQDDFGGVTGVLTVHRTPEGKLRTF